MMRALSTATLVLVCQAVVALGQDTSPRGLWVWETRPLLQNLDDRRGFFEFCKRHDISVVGMQIATTGSGTGRRLAQAAEWRGLITEGRRRGMRLHALDGDPGFALRGEHDTALSIVDAVIAYNKSVAASERFYGIHFDIEPYLLPEWKDPRGREQLLAEYLDLNDRAAKRSRAAKLVYGVDIPFWWYAIDTGSGQSVSITTFRGVRKPTPDHLLTIVDNVGIMAYRNVAAGPDGIITLALDTLDRADSIGKAQAFVGLETEKVSDGVPAKATFAGKSLEQLRKEAQAVDDVFIGRPAYAGIALHHYLSLKRLKER